MKNTYTIVRIVNSHYYLIDRKYHLSHFTWIMKNQDTVTPGSLNPTYKYPRIYLVYLLHNTKRLQKLVARLTFVDIRNISVLDFLASNIDFPYSRMMLKDL